MFICFWVFFYPCLLVQFKKKSSKCLFLDLCVCGWLFLSVPEIFCLSLGSQVKQINTYRFVWLKLNSSLKQMFWVKQNKKRSYFCLFVCFIYTYEPTNIGVSPGQKDFLFNIFLNFFFHHWFNPGSGVLGRHFLLVDYICVNVSNCRLIKQLNPNTLTIGPIRSQNMKFMKCVCVCVITDIITEITILALVWCHPKSQGHCFYFSKNNFSVFMYNVCTEIKYSQLDFRVSFFHSILIVVCLYCDVCLNSKGSMSNYFTIIIVV